MRNRTSLILFFLFVTVFPECISGKVVAGAGRFEQYLPFIQGKRVGMVVNHTSVVGTGQTHLLDTLLKQHINVVKVFAPEHGFRGNADAGETVKDGKDSRTGIPIVSLYGDNIMNRNIRMKEARVCISVIFFVILHKNINFSSREQKIEHMNPYEIIDKYYPENTEQRQILVIHSLSVAGKAMKILDAHPELRLNRSFVKEAALLHDIGIFQTDAPTIQCFGSHPYIAHGYLGAEILREEGFPQHALVCERHTGAGLSLQDIVDQQLPVPHREMLPITLEEQLICFADKFFSKTHLDEEKSVEKARHSIAKYGEEGLSRFDRWCSLFL